MNDFTTRQNKYINSLQQKWKRYSNNVNIFVYGEIGTGKDKSCGISPKTYLHTKF